MSGKSGAGHQPVIIVKKKGHAHHGHHGGAWKVAYADFVTAMMAFFLVMWIIGQSAQVKAGIAGYFREPTAFAEGGGGNGVLPGAQSGMDGGAAPLQPAGPSSNAGLEEAAAELRRVLATLPDFENLKDQVEITVTEEGLRIELRESPNDGFFASGSAEAKPQTVELLDVIAEQLKTLPNKIALEGHTDSRPYSAEGGAYTNWELSADRANAARRVMQRAGLRGDQIEGVRGFADTRLRFPENPLDPGNRRISIVVRRG